MVDGPSRGEERRAAARHFTCYPFHFQAGDAGDTGDTEIALIQDVSPTGALLLVGAELPIGTRVKLHLDFLDGLDSGLGRIVEGRVVRNERRPRARSDVWPFGAAVQFTEEQADLTASVLELERQIESSG
ncbi:MAG: PilZ domain-containing protein [Polyangiaceae bacterium]